MIDEIVTLNGCAELIIFVDYVKGSESGASVFPYVLIPEGDPEEESSWYPLTGKNTLKEFVDIEVLPMTESKKFAFWVKVPSMFQTIRIKGDLAVPGDGTLAVSVFPVRSLTPFDEES
jgi:hypothetical protein